MTLGFWESIHYHLKQIAMSSININEKVIETTSKNVTIKNGRVIVDGKDVTPESKEIIIKVEGNIEKLEVYACNKVEVKGEVGTIKTMSGDVKVSGNVNGDIKTMAGDIDCGSVSGDISTISGDVKHK